MDIGIVTSSKLPNLDDDSRLLLDHLLARGVDTRPVIWDDPSVDWSSMQVCLVRSTWDYHERLPAFIAWMKQADRVTSLWNPLNVLLWNTDKVYLKAFQAKGVRTVETLWFSNGNVPDLQAILELQGWDELIVKPTISAAAANTFRVNASNVKEVQAKLPALVQEKELMIQPFLKTVETTGESSLIYINGQFAHAIIKRPATGDFRVQEHWGGYTEAYTPSAEELKVAESVLSAVDDDLLYARVDLIQNAQGEPCLVELEVTEPSLYLKYSPEHTVSVLSNVLCDKLKARNTQETLV